MPTRGDYPIILAHGICRFDQWLNETFGMDNRDDDSLHYFKRIRSTLMKHGYAVFHSKVGWADGVDTRAEQLRMELIRHTNDFRDSPKVHIIAHSMGGLDARHMIYNYRMEDRVASLTTIGTPHHGSSFADWGVGSLLGRILIRMKPVGIDLTGLRDLTTQKCREFNEKAADFERSNGVKYQTYAGVQPRERIFRPLRRAHRIIRKREGPNDGLVSLESAKWRPEVFKGQIDADHLNEVGWCDPAAPGGAVRRESFEEEIRQFYVDIANGLA